MRAFRSSLIAALASLALGATSAARAGTIQQTIQFPGVAPEAVYAAYMSAKGHSAMTGFPVSFYRAAAKQEGVAIQHPGYFKQPYVFLRDRI